MIEFYCVMVKYASIALVVVLNVLTCTNETSVKGHRTRLFSGYLWFICELKKHDAFNNQLKQFCIYHRFAANKYEQRIIVFNWSVSRSSRALYNMSIIFLPSLLNCTADGCTSPNFFSFTIWPISGGSITCRLLENLMDRCYNHG